MRKSAKRIYGTLLSMSMLVTLLAVPVWAAEPVETGQEQAQEQKQIQEQEQIQEQIQEQEEGQVQNPEHEHTEACYTLIENCVHEHAAECYGQTTGTGTVSGNDVMETVEAQPTACTHVCSEESGCITKEWNCGYNGENNGVPATVGASQSTGTVEYAVALGELSAPMLTANGTGDVSTEEELSAALADKDISEVKLMNDIDIRSTLMVGRTVTLDLNGCVLKMTGNGSVIQIKDGGLLTLEDNNASSSHIFNSNSIPWILDENGTKTVSGGVITGGTGTQVPSYGTKGGGVYIEPEGRLEMNGGSIVGCKANYGGGVYIDYDGNNKNYGAFVMNKGNIMGCEAKSGGGVTVEEGCNFTMNSGSEISYCNAKQNTYTQGDGYGGGVMINNGGKPGVFTMNGGAIHSCTADNYGGGIDNSGTFVMSGGQIYGCTARSGGGVRNYELFIMSGGEIGAPGNNDKSDIVNYGANLTISDKAEIYTNVSILNGSILNADGGEISGSVTNGNRDEGYGRITGSKGAAESTRFSGSVTNTSDYRGHKSIIEKGTFTGSVTNNDGCTIRGGDFSKANLSGYLEIIFEPGNGDPDITQEVEWKNNGETLTEPNPSPVKENYTIEGWYYDDNGTEKKWDFDKDRTIYTMTLKAKWKQNTTPVPPGETEPKDMNHDNISRNNINPNNTDYYDTGGTNESSETAPVIYPTLTFDTCGGSSIKAVRAFKGHTINLSGYLPIREGYEFSSWYADQNLTQPVTEIRLNGNRTVYAGWIKQAEQAGENPKSKAASGQLIVNDNGQSPIENYKPDSSDTPENMENQITENQVTEDQSAEVQIMKDTGDDQKPTMDNSPADNESKPDDSADLPSEGNSHSGGWIPVICISTGILVIALGLYLGYRRGKKVDKKIDKN